MPDQIQKKINSLSEDSRFRREENSRLEREVAITKRIVKDNKDTIDNNYKKIKMLREL